MKWYFEKDDRFWSAAWTDEGDLTLQEGPIGGEPESTTTEEHEDGDAARAAVIAKFKAMPAGWSQVRPPEERWEQDPKIAEWYESDFFEELVALGAAEPREPNDVPGTLAEYHNVTLPPELKRFLEWRARHHVGYTNYGEWRIWEDDSWVPDPEKGNLFEQILLLNQHNYLGTTLQEYFAGFICLGTAGNGDVYFASADITDPQRAEVFIWDHEEQSPYPFADGISTLAWANHLYEQVSEGEFSEEELTSDMERIAERASLSWHYREQVETSDVEPEYSQKTDALYYWYRAMYLCKLLQQDGVTPMDEIQNLFFDLHQNLTFEDALDSPHLPKNPITALYWMWRLFFFKHEEDLERCLKVCREHSSPLVRDAAKVIDEINGGRKQLGTIEDIQALRKRFLDLDIDPARAEERAAEEAAAEAAAEAKRKEDIERAEKLVAEHSPEELVKLAWDEVQNPAAIDVLYAAIEEGLPEEADNFERLRFLLEGRSNRNNSIYRFEENEVKEALVARGQKLGPKLAASEHLGMVELAARAADSEEAKRAIRAVIEPVLAERNDYHHRERTAVRMVTALGADDLLPTLVKMLDEFLWDDSDRMASIKNEGMVYDLCDAIGTLGDKSHLTVLAPVATDGPDVKVRLKAIINIGKIGGDKAAEMLGAIESPRRPTLYALAQTGSKHAAEVLQQRLGREFGEPPALTFEQVMLQRARHGAGLSVDDATLKTAATVIESKKYQDMDLHASLAECLPGADDRQWALQTARLLLEHDSERVRQAAIGALEAMGEPVTIRYADRAVADRAFESGGQAALMELLQGENVVFRHNALRKAIDEDAVSDQLVGAAVEWARRVPCRFDYYTNGYVQDKHDTTHYTIQALAQLEHEVADRFLGELLVSSNAMYSQADTFKYNRSGARDRIEKYKPEASESGGTPDFPLEYQRISFAPFAVGKGINGLAWSPDGSRLTVASESGVRLLSVDGEQLFEFPSTRGGWCYDVTWHPTGQYLAFGAHAGHLHLLDPDTGRQLADLRGHSGVPNGVRKLAFSPDGSRLASVSNDETLQLWDLSDFSPNDEVQLLQPVWTWDDNAEVNGVTWLGNDSLAIITDHAIHLLAPGVDNPNKTIDKASGADLCTDIQRERFFATTKQGIRGFTFQGEPLDDLTFDQTSVARLRLTQDGRYLYAASWEGDQGLIRWDIENGEPTTFTGHEPAIFGLDLHPVTEEPAVGGKLNMVVRWTTNGDLLATDTPFHTNEISDFTWSDTHVYSASDDGTIIEWSREDWTPGRVFRPSRGGTVDGVALSSDGSRLLAAGKGATAFDLDTGEELWTTELARSEFLAVHGDEVMVANDRALTWLSVEDGSEVTTVEGAADGFFFWMARVDGSRVLTAGYDDTHVVLWDLAAHQELARFTLPGSSGDRLKGLTATAKRFFGSRWDKTIVAFDLEAPYDNTEYTARVSLEYGPPGLAVSPDGNTLVTARWVLNTRNWQAIGLMNLPEVSECIRYLDESTLLIGAASGAVYVARLTQVD